MKIKYINGVVSSFYFSFTHKKVFFQNGGTCYSLTPCVYFESHAGENSSLSKFHSQRGTVIVIGVNVKQLKTNFKVHFVNNISLLNNGSIK